MPVIILTQVSRFKEIKHFRMICRVISFYLH